MLTHIYLKRIPRHDRRHKLDVLGAVLMMASCIPILLALTWGGTLYEWLSWPILGLIAASLVLSLLFGWRLATASEPFLPLTVLNNPVMRLGTASASLAMGVSIGLTIVVPMYFEVAHRLTATESGIALIPLALTTPGSLLAGQAMLYWKHYKRAPVIGLVLRAGGAGVPDLAAGHAARLVARAAERGRHRDRRRLSGHHGVDPERGAAPSGRQCDGRAELLPLAGVGLRGGGAGRDPARGPRRIGAGRRGSVSVVATAERGRRVRRWRSAGCFSALVFLALSLLFLILMEERPLRGTTAEAPTPPPE